MPKLTISLDKMKHNLNYVINLANEHNLGLVVVTKCIQSDKKLIDFLSFNGVKTIADVYRDNLCRQSKNLRKMLMITPLSSMNRSVEDIDYVYVSEFKVIEQIAELNLKKPPEVIIPIELGELREGVMPEDVVLFIEKVLKLNKMKVKGIATNYGCLRGLLPDEKNINELVDLFYKVKKTIGLELEVVSVGGTVVLDMIKKNKMPPEINQIRIGEAIFFGYDMSNQRAIEGLYQDVFVFSAEIIEIKDKDTRIKGQLGYNAFGEKITLPYNGGVRKNCVLGFGELISPHIGLSCISDSIDFVGSTHNHTVADFTNAKKTWLVGDFVDFIGNYNCIAHIMISPFVEKIIV